MAKCPACNKLIAQFVLKSMKSEERLSGRVLEMLAHCCPYCDTVISVHPEGGGGSSNSNRGSGRSFL